MLFRILMKEQSKLSRKPRRFLPIRSLSPTAFLQRSNQRINPPVRTQRHGQSHGTLRGNFSHIITRNCIDRNNRSSFYTVRSKAANTLLHRVCRATSLPQCPAYLLRHVVPCHHQSHRSEEKTSPPASVSDS